MAQAASLRAGAVVRHGGVFHKAVQVDVHQGGGKMGSMVHLKLRNLETGALSETRYNPRDEVEAVPVERTKMQFLYAQGDQFTFMNPETFDQVPLTRSIVGPAAPFLKENDLIEVEFFEGKPLSLQYPGVAEAVVASTGAGIRGQTDSTYKEAVLDNGMQVLVPQFIKPGDRVRLEVETGKYLDRVGGKA